MGLSMLGPVVLETAACPVGCPPDDEPVCVGHDRLHGLLGTFQVVRCRHCGLMRTDPRPTIETIGFYYPHDYAPHGTGVLEPATGVTRFLRNTLQRLQPAWLRNRRIPPLQPKRLLEIGCAAGRCLAEMREAGWSVVGVEISAKAVASAHAHGLQVYQGTVESLPKDAGPFELFIGWMTLEHLHDPIQTLRLLRCYATPESWLVLSVPNAEDRLGFRLFRDRWFALQLPTHLFHFTPSSLEAVLEASGWRLEKTFWQLDSTNFLWSTSYWLKERGARRSAAILAALAARPRNPLVAGVSVLLGLLRCSGSIVVWARPN